MNPVDKKQALLRHLPKVDVLLDQIDDRPDFSAITRNVRLWAIRHVLDRTRQDIQKGLTTSIDQNSLLDGILAAAMDKAAPRLVPVINATGVVLHTNLGRAPLCDQALENIHTIARGYANLEFNIKAGKRGMRYDAVEDLLCELTGAQSAVVVNNNAGAVLLALNTLASGADVIVSRGELVEIGGSFRIPDVMNRSGCRLKEVGTTNRTHPGDYEAAISEETALLLKVHTSNYRIQGFTKSVPVFDLVAIGDRHGIKVMEDLGSGTLIDFAPYGMPSEPTVSETVASGVDLVTFSGDKLLGGPQAGIILGKKDAVDQVKANPLTRALRIDKLTLAALEATLALYRDETQAIRHIPTLRMLTRSFDDICRQAEILKSAIAQKNLPDLEINTADLSSRPGGGSYPALTLPTRCITLKPQQLSVSRLEQCARNSKPALIGRIETDCFILDPRTIQDGQEALIADILEAIFTKGTA